MSNQVLQPTRASNVFPSDSVNIPYPNIVLTGTTTDPGSSSLVDTNVNFIELGIKIGDSVYDPFNFNWSTVVYVSENELGMNDTSFDGASTTYIVYQGKNTGCTLYIGTIPEGADGGSLVVLTSDNNKVLLEGVPAGSFLPIKVLRVYTTGTNCSDIIALW